MPYQLPSCAFPEEMWDVNSQLGEFVFNVFYGEEGWKVRDLYHRDFRLDRLFVRTEICVWIPTDKLHRLSNCPYVDNE